MPRKKTAKAKRVRGTTLVESHLNNISRALLEGEKRPAFLDFLQQNSKHGIYALYNKDRLYYVGKAIDLMRRLGDHLKDRHKDGWDRMSLFFIKRSEDIAELEGLLVASAKPHGNKQRPKVGKDMRKELEQHLMADARGQIKQMIFSERMTKNKQVNADRLALRITPKKLKHIPQNKLARALNITPGRVSQLKAEDKEKYTALRRYIQEGGHRDKVLLLLDKQK